MLPRADNEWEANILVAGDNFDPIWLGQSYLYEQALHEDHAKSSIPCSSSFRRPLTSPCSSLEVMGTRVMLPWLGFSTACLYTWRLWLYPCASPLRL